MGLGVKTKTKNEHGRDCGRLEVAKGHVAGDWEHSRVNVGVLHHRMLSYFTVFVSSVLSSVLVRSLS